MRNDEEFYTCAAVRAAGLALKFVCVILLSSPLATAAAIDFAEPPTFTPNPSGRVPLAAVIEFAGSEPVDTHIEITDGENTWDASFAASHAVAGKYSIPVLGMRAAREHKITLTLRAADGKVHTETFTHTTPGYPDQLSFPNIVVSVSEPERMEPGVTFLSTRRRALGRGHWLTKKQYEWSANYGLIVALDNNGEVIWWYESSSRMAGIERLQNGNILMHRFSSTLIIDMLGNVLAEYYPADNPLPHPDNPNAISIRDQQTLHHQPHELPDGNFLAFTANGYPMQDWYTSEADPDAPREDAMVMADSIVIFTPEGEQIWTWDTMDYLDPWRLGRDTFWSYWWTRGFDQYRDWTHGNGLSYDARDDSILVSLRNQSAILKIDKKTKEIKWILGHHRNWPEHLRDKLLTPVGDLLWPAYQHNPRVTHAGTIILFDNRPYSGAMAFEDYPPLAENFSRAVEYKVDEANMTVQQVWSSGDTQTEDSCFTYAMSDAWRLPKTDNRLVIHAFCVPLIPGLSEDIMDPTKRVTDDIYYPGGHILEYAGDKVVFQVDFGMKHELFQWNVYGGFRSPSIYHTPGAAH
ncbi:MAG: aryl-sulfate sulfotransferase [Gammaproteobacteria bacterium]|nr:aryl-sulfate sulfotransferase [Gammaproteobacteria bacterium]MCY4339456.1 aryl-sulfate sulfotransferase [Gammaproteobacteria bacterium]